MISKIKENAKNIIGWKTKRKIVVFSVDDYGNIRLASTKASQNLDKAGIKLSRFDQIDTLETKQDLEEMLETLSAVKDINGNHPVLTMFSVPCNIDFQRMAEDNYQTYHYELLPQTFNKLAMSDPVAYDGAWNLWKEGMSKGLFVPQFHGREHFNLKIFEEKLKNRDRELLTALKNHSNPGLSDSGSARVKYTAAFEFWDFSDNQMFEHIIKDGLNAFEKVFGYRSVHFNAPNGNQHHVLYDILYTNGINYIDNPIIKKEHQGSGKYKTILNYTGKRDPSGLVHVVRNVVFEPTIYNSADWVDYTMQQITSAFRWNRPAIISSHRANFCGHLDPENRKQGLMSLKILLEKLIKKWPEIEFMSADKLGDLITIKK